LATLAKLDATSNESKFLRTKLVRERNRIWDALNTARQAIDRAL